MKGRYRIEREIGAGGMATVYLAEDLKHHRRVALKVLKPELAEVVGAERFLAEIETTAKLQHPNILPLFDSGEVGGLDDTPRSIFLVMPHVEGATLRERLRREHQLPVDEAVRIAVEVADALDHAHRNGVVHRDIKPANILLRDGRPLVADFGIALAAYGSGVERRLTETGLSLGTPYYMSPEQATGDESVGPATDVYALGCVLYEALTGEPPYTGKTPQAVLGKIITGETPEASKLRKTVPPNVNGAIARAIEKVPADRFRSAGAFADALADQGFRWDVTAGRAATDGPARQSPLSAALGILALGLALVLGWTLFRQDPPAPVARHVLRVEGVFPWAAPVGRLSAIAPDGSSMILPVGTTATDYHLAMKARAATELIPLDGTELSVTPVYAPDGDAVAHIVGTELRVLNLDRGTSRVLADNADGSQPVLHWLYDGTILYKRGPRDGQPGALVRIPEDGGEPAAVDLGDSLSGWNVRWIRGLPDGRGFLVVACHPGCAAEGPASGSWIGCRGRCARWPNGWGVPGMRPRVISCT